jgi:RNA polymerase sigma factor (sigma-70 family)
MDAARTGDQGAFAELWERHSGAALTVARSFTTIDADDVVSEAFARVYAAVRKGGGPTSGFRPYLFTTVRNVAASWGRSDRTTTVEDIGILTDDSTAETEALDALERGATVQAFRSLPHRWQEVLWYTEVEGMPPRRVAVLLGMKPNSVAALAVRAREGLRQAWITKQLAAGQQPDCVRAIERLPAYVRGTLGARPAHQVREHLSTCPTCPAAAEEAGALSSRLALILLPVTAGIGGAAAHLGTLPSHTAATVSATGSVPSARIPRTSVRHALTSTAGAKAAAISAGFVLLAGGGTAAAILAFPTPAEPTVVSQSGAESELGNSEPAPPVPSVAPPTTATPTPGPTTSPAPAPEPPDQDPPFTNAGPDQIPSAPSEQNTSRPEADPPESNPPTSSPPPSAPPTPPAQPPAVTAPTLTVKDGPNTVYPTLVGLAEPGATVTVTTIEPSMADAATTQERHQWDTVADATGGWSTVLDEIPPGTTTIVAVQKSTEGVTSGPSAPIIVTLEDPPTIHITELTPTTDRLEVSGRSDATVRIYIRDWVTGPLHLDHDGYWSILIPAGAPRAELSVRYVDGTAIGPPGRLSPDDETPLLSPTEG